MKQIKVSEATNIQLDWLVAKCEGHKVVFNHQYTEEVRFDGWWQLGPKHWQPLNKYTNDWSQMGPILDREKISIRHWDNTPVIHAYMPTQGSDWSAGQTPLIAAARCYVASKLGDTVEVPEELT